MPNPDSIQEVQVVASSASAEFGKEPGVSMNAITKSGTNDFHGTAFFATHATDLNANFWSANLNGSPVPTDVMNRMDICVHLTYTLQRSLASGSSEGQEVGITSSAVSRAANPRNIRGEIASVVPRRQIRCFFNCQLPRLSYRPILKHTHDAWNVKDDLPHLTVQAILQARDGYIWLGTHGSLARFDGLRFVPPHD